MVNTRSRKHPRRSSFVTTMLAVIVAVASVTGSAGLAAAAPPGTAPPESPVEFSVPNGRFFTQANGQGGGNGLGFVVSDDGNAQFWAALQRMGGVNVVGYPVSQRFEWKGRVTQVFQKLVLQWQPEIKSVAFVNVFDEMALAGKDGWLKEARSTPERLVLAEDGKTWDQIVKNRLSFLDANPAIKARYFSTPDYLNRYGLPTSQVQDLGNAYVIRLQRAVMQQWKVNVPWAKAGEVTIANGGDITKEAGLYPESAVKPESAESDIVWKTAPRNPRALTVVIDPGHGGREPGAVHRFADGSLLYEKDVNLKVALGLGNELYRLGYNVVMTRRADVQLTLQARVDIANNARADIFVSVHHNGSGNQQMAGTEVYYCDSRPFVDSSRDLAASVQAGLVRSLRGSGYPAVDRGYKTDSKAVGQGRHFYLLGPQSRLIARSSSMPAIIGEGLFVSNDKEANLLRQEGFLAALSNGYVLGINRYFALRGK